MTNYYLIVVIFASIFIIILAFFTTRFISGGLNPNITSKNIKFIEKLPLGVDKSLILVELDNNFYLMYLSKTGAQLIDKLDSLELKDPMSKNISFKDILSNFKNLRNK